MFENPLSFFGWLIWLPVTLARHWRYNLVGEISKSSRLDGTLYYSLFALPTISTCIHFNLPSVASPLMESMWMTICLDVLPFISPHKGYTLTHCRRYCMCHSWCIDENKAREMIDTYIGHRAWYMQRTCSSDGRRQSHKQKNFTYFDLLLIVHFTLAHKPPEHIEDAGGLTGIG